MAASENERPRIPIAWEHKNSDVLKLDYEHRFQSTGAFQNYPDTGYETDSRQSGLQATACDRNFESVLSDRFPRLDTNGDAFDDQGTGGMQKMTRDIPFGLRPGAASGNQEWIGDDAQDC